MSNNEQEQIEAEVLQPEKQSPALAGFLKNINTARVHLSLYGADHTSTLKAAEELSKHLDEFIEDIGRVTLVFAKNAVIVNEHYYASSSDSNELFQRLRIRGVMAITFVGSASPEQILNFLMFLNTEPRYIRIEDGPSMWLRKHQVNRIVATEAVYMNDGDDSEEDESISRINWESNNVDQAIGAALEWLSKQDEEKDKSPQLPITEILSNPEKAAKLIREAVTKLHASRREETTGELTSEVVNDLKDLAGYDKESWDKATPQIRKALSKLPKEMRPHISGFIGEEDDLGDRSDDNRKTADIGEVECTVSTALKQITPPICEPLPGPEKFESLFGARANGLLSNWRKELQPVSIIRSSANTLETLMIWENGTLEHERITNALIALILRALEMNDTGSAVLIMARLIEEMKREQGIDWRCSNVKTALQSLETPVLITLVEEALKSGDTNAQNVATALVEALPSLAISLIHLLGANNAPAFDETLKRGLARCGQSAIASLGRLLNDNDIRVKEAALEALISISGTAAIREIALVLNSADISFIIRALDLLPSVRIPQVTEICISKLTHSSTDVRCAALKALGELGDESAIPYITRIATHGSLRDENSAEKIAAINALACIGGNDAWDFLQKMAAKRPLIGRNRYEVIKIAAERALQQLQKDRAVA